MPLLALPDPPFDESISFKQRILKKFEAFLAAQAAGKTNSLREQGERYEIAVALYLYRNHLLKKAEYLSRWQLPGETRDQSIRLGLSNEYDFLIDHSNGVLLGDAKSEASGLGPYFKQAISFCLLDFFVRQRENRLAGFCFATPAHPLGMFWTALRNSLEILTALTECSGITGMDLQQLPTDVKIYFRSRYLVNNQVLRRDAFHREPAYYLAELRDKAGFTFEFLQIPAMSQDEIARQMDLLAGKARWKTS